MTLTELRTKLREKKVEYTIAVLVALSMLLFGVIWWGWLYGLLARTGAAIPRRVLGAIIGVLAIWLTASLTLVTLYARALNTAKAENKSLAELPAQLQKAQEDNRILRTELDDIEAQRSSASVELQQALAHLHSFSQNLPQNSDIEEKFVDEYHGIVTAIEIETGQHLDRFRIQPSEVAYHVRTVTPRRRSGSFVFTSTPETRQSDYRYCAKAVFRTRLDALVKYLADV